MGDPVLMTAQLNIRFSSLREAMKSYILFKGKQFGVKEVRRQHLHIYAGVFIFCLCLSLGDWFPCLRDLFEEPLHWLDAWHNGLLWSNETYVFFTVPLCLLLLLPKNITNPVKPNQTNKNLEEVDLVKVKGGHVSGLSLASL